MLNFDNELGNNIILPGFEVMIDTQFDDNILGVISDIFTAMQGTKGIHDKKYLNLSKKLADKLSNRFGIPMEVSHEYDFFACIPVDQYSNILIPTYSDEKPNSKKMIKKIEEFKKREITIDLKRAYISGLEGVYKTKLYIDHDLITSGKLTIDELVAIQVHEIGHAFTYIHHSNKIVKNNVTLLESFIYTSGGMKDKGKKILINSTKTNNGNEDMVIESIGKDTVKSMEALKVNILGGGNTNGKDSETEADAFATRFGVSADLATGLSKMLSFTNSIKYVLLVNVIYTLIMTIQIMIIYGVSYIGVFGIILFRTLVSGTLYVATFNLITSLIVEIGNLTPSAFPYTKLDERINRMKLELIKILRSSKLNKEDKQSLLKQIDRMMEINSKDNIKMFGNIFSQLTSDVYNYGKDINIEKIYNNTMNTLQNNDLHYLSEKINPDNIKVGNESWFGNNVTHPVFKDYNNNKYKKELNKYIIDLRTSMYKKLKKHSITGVYADYLIEDKTDKIFAIDEEIDGIVWDKNDYFVLDFVLVHVDISKQINMREYNKMIDEDDTSSPEYIKVINILEDSLKDIKNEYPLIVSTFTHHDDISSYYIKVKINVSELLKLPNIKVGNEDDTDIDEEYKY